MNYKKLRIAKKIALMLLLSIYGTGFAQSYKIIKIRPDQKILIGNKWCGKDSIFSEDQRIVWDDKLDVQAFQAIEINNPNHKVELSKNKIRERSQENFSLAQMFSRGLYVKGSSDILILWDDEPLVLDVPVDSGYVYLIVINNDIKEHILFPQNGRLQLTADMFAGYQGIVEVSLQRESKNNNYYIETLHKFKIELATIDKKE